MPYDADERLYSLWVEYKSNFIGQIPYALSWWGEQARTYDLTNAIIGDRVWLDSNSNGIQDTGEPGLPGVKLRLINTGTGAIVDTRESDSDGKYLFKAPQGQLYHIEVERPEKYRFTLKNATGSASNNDNDIDLTTGLSDAFQGDAPG